MTKKPLAKVVLTGGGTAGHVMPHIALLEEMRARDWDLHYIGSRSGIERQLMHDVGVKYTPIQTGKLRRYWSFENLLDLFRVVVGVCQSLLTLMFLRPDVVFSKGGFVSVPVALGARLLRIPVVTHESDRSPGLANRIILKFAHSIAYTFPDTQRFLPPGRGVRCASPVRQQLLNGDMRRGLEFCGFDPESSVPVVLVMGGSLGAQRLNELIATSYAHLCEQVRVVHITGKHKPLLPQVDPQRYVAFEYVDRQLADLYACASFVIARAGANSLFEYRALRLPMILVPLEIGSRGDQLENASYFESLGVAKVFRETALDPTVFTETLGRLIQQDFAAMRQAYSQLEQQELPSVLSLVAQAIQDR
ncbi:MAG: UDP-N-acetylglucosamine--N-acetylmuramyl-(pentapeptide) pyrophosphoryl-undecaprenol N-acetylglucosamine transferase [Zetaproteobacteria bacterium]|nr:UDP-N-acetylglucosamine--N-acetylmuramyl-(pentapeptide) pyrophosphoryl-undecaprenol N-acetylglucosamine transferase [Zetaproteobacteria bacterium]